MGLAVSGLASGMDVDAMINSLMKLEARRLLFLQQKEAEAQIRLTGYGNLSSALTAFQSASAKLAMSTAFDGMVAVSSDSDLFSGTASTSAIAGTYNIRVDAVAREQNLASSAYADSNLTVVGTGTLNIKVGTESTVYVAINTTNNTLTGIQDAINASGVKVKASIINDGSGNKLVFRSTETGTANTITVTVSDNDGNDTDTNGLSNLASVNLTETQTALDAQFNINGIDITKSSNTVTDVINGITLTLNAKDVTKTKTLTVSHDTTTPTTEIKAFVDAYNELITTMSALQKVDEKTGVRGILVGDSTLRNVEFQLKNKLTSGVSGLTGDYTTLSSVGISVQRDGTLQLDTSKLAAAFTDDPNAVKSVFSKVGQSTNTNIQYITSTDSTLTDNYSIYINAAAQQGSYTGTAITPPVVITEGVNDSLIIEIEGVSSTIFLDAGTYNAGADLATEIGQKIDANTEFVKKATAAFESGKLILRTVDFGESATVDVTGGTAASDLGLAAGTAAVGVNVNGTIGGVAASGVGQLLTSSNGLQVKYLGSTTGAVGILNYTIGIAELAKRATDSMLDANNGTVTARTEGISDTIDDIRKSIEKEQARLVSSEALLRQKFNALEQIISQLNATSDFLAQAMPSLNNAFRYNRGK